MAFYVISRSQWRIPNFLHATTGILSRSRQRVKGSLGYGYIKCRSLCECVVDWGYEEQNGPKLWPQKFIKASGTQQSPIDICSGLLKHSDVLPSRPLEWRFGQNICRTLSNAGQGWKVCADDTDSSLEGGPLEHKYQLAQFHSHWGVEDDCGSEHTVDGKSYAGELHLVFWNTSLFSSFSEAVSKESGLAVLGVFLDVGQENPELMKICNQIEKIQHKDQQTVIPDGVDPSAFIPENQSYWTYPGSLTTPPCYETVTWILFKHPIEISKEQLDTFRKLCFYKNGEACPTGCFNGHVLSNHRHPQPIYNRKVILCNC